MRAMLRSGETHEMKLQSFLDVPIPSRMQQLPRDARGYPVPVIVFIDEAGRPHLQISDEAKRERVIANRLCGICGQPLSRGKWFVGGAVSAFDPAGAYLDPPLHGECLRYAMQVCPYLGAPRYAKRIDGATLRQDGESQYALSTDPFILEGRPKIFVTVMALEMRVVRGELGQAYMLPKKPYRHVEYWQYGSPIDAADALRQLREEGHWEAATGHETSAGEAFDPTNLPLLPKRRR
jgi:hypothetical protein